MKLKVMLINPPRVEGYPVVREERFEHKDIGSVYPPLSLLYTAAVLEKKGNCDIKFLDANGYDLTYNKVRAEIIKFSPDIIIARCGFDTQKEDIESLSAAKDIGAVIVIRNKIIADTPYIRDDLLKQGKIDIFMDSEPEAVIGQLIDVFLKRKKEKKSERQPSGCLRDPEGGKEENPGFLNEVKGISYYYNGKNTTTPKAEEIQNLDELPYPAYHMLPSLDVYHTGVMGPPFGLVATTRGCPYACTFCAYGKSKCRERSVESVIGELKELKEKHKIKSFLFFDDTISIRSGRIEKLCERMIEEGLNSLSWVCCTRADLLTYGALKIMKKAGMKEIAIGIETGSEKILKNIKKGVSLRSIRNTAKWCHELKIMFYGLAIIGLPGETEETVNETVDFIKEIDPFYTQFCFSVPFPNTEMFGYYEKNSLLLTRDWSKYFPLSEEPVAGTEALSGDELKKLRNRAYKKILLRPGYLLRKIRPFDWKWNISGLIKVAGRIINVVKGRPVR